jgi:LysM domain
VDVVAALVDYPREAFFETPRPRIAPPRPDASRARPANARARVSHAEVYRRRRLAVAAAALIAVALLIVVVNLAVQAALGRTGGGPLTATGALPGGNLAGSVVYVVRPGDTIWSIARSIEPNRDVRPLVDRISSRLGGAPLYPGQRISITLNR